MVALSISFVSGVAVLVFCGSGVLCAPLCLAGDFDSQLWTILHSQMLSAQDPVVTQVLDDVRATLNQRWQGYELTLYGSLAAGLGTITSDIDLGVQLQNYNASAGMHVLKETVKLLNKQPELYSQVKVRRGITFIFSVCSMYHIPSEREIEIEYETDVVYEYIHKTKITKYYFELDKRFKPLGVFLKYWLKIHGLAGHGVGNITGHALYLLIIFYLQQKNMAPPAYLLQVNSNWNSDLKELPYSTTNTESLHQLLGGFFKYYSEFNFEEYIVSPFTGRPIPKNDFTDIYKFTEDFTFNEYDNTLNTTMQIVVKIDLDSEISIQDIFVRDFNNIGQISQEQATKFRSLMKSVTKLFEELPSDRILTAILATDEPKETSIDLNNAMNGIY